MRCVQASDHHDFLLIHDIKILEDPVDTKDLTFYRGEHIQEILAFCFGERR